jgi:hypothetical protein
MTTKFDTNLLMSFLNSLNDKKEWKSRNAKDWGSHFDSELNNILNRRFTRNDFNNAEIMNKLSDREIAIAILSWGAMRYDHGKRLFENESFIDVISKMKAGNLNRKEAYNAFFELKAKGEINGMGPAYYTKLICFTNRNLGGYIMDQWTAKSINLLTGSNLIKLTSVGMVSDQNSAEVYETFCNHIELLSDQTRLSPLDTEEALFSYGGRRKGSWRKFVIANS